MEYHLDANGTDGTDPSKVDRVYKDGTRIASNNTKAIAEREAKDAAEVVRREALVVSIRKVSDNPDYTNEDMRDALGAVVELYERI